MQFVVLITMLILSGCAHSQKSDSQGGNSQGKEFTSADLKKMSTFLSNFTELWMYEFTTEELVNSDGQPELVRFGVRHNYGNNYNSRVSQCKVKDCPHGSLAIDVKYVNESIKKYFDVDLKENKSVKPDYDSYKEYEYYSDGKQYHFEGSDGEATYFARVDEAHENADGQIVMTGELYNAEEGEENDILGKFEALAKPHKFNGKDTWAIISLKTEYK